MDMILKISLRYQFGEPNVNLDWTLETTPLQHQRLP